MAVAMLAQLLAPPADPPEASSARPGRGPRVVLADPGVELEARFALPVPHSSVTMRDLRAPHHDYPASDLMVPSGTPVFAAVPGRARVHDGERCGLGVSVDGPAGRRFVYCHLSVVAVADQAVVGAGDVLGLSGDTGNAKGVPHLHFHVLDGDRYICPQALMAAWFELREPPLGAWTISQGCFFPRG